MMRGALIGLVAGLFLMSCGTKTEQAFKAKQCQDFELARHEVLKNGHRLTDAEKKRAIVLYRLAAMHCSTSIEWLTQQMRELAR